MKERANKSHSSLTIKSLAGNIFTSVLVFTLAVIVVLAGAMTTLYYLSYEHDDEDRLSASAQDAAAYLNASGPDQSILGLEQQFAGMVRYTLIASDGRVLYDSAVNSSTLENHGDRPEVREAKSTGNAVVVRHSTTLDTDTVYAAVKLDNNTIIRLAETRHSLLAFLGDMLIPVLVALVIAAALVFILSKMLTRRIMKPIDALNFANPLENEIYEEMNPLLIRIDNQQHQLKQQNRELAQAENMRRDFSSNVSHEMKTPLQVISGYAELMKNDLVQADDRQKFAELIYEEAQAMRSLINDVLTLSRLDESAFGDDAKTLLDVKELGQRVAARLESFAAKQHITLSVEGAHGHIKGSETLAEEMLYNLIENGIRYNHEGGRVTLFIQNERPSPRFQEGSVLVRVRDTGPGIPHDLHDKVFERFFRIEKSRSKETGGTGLGLAIVKHAVMYHGGDIEVNSIEGKGTTFVLRFPGASATAAKEKSHPRPEG